MLDSGLKSDWVQYQPRCLQRRPYRHDERAATFDSDNLDCFLFSHCVAREGEQATVMMASIGSVTAKAQLSSQLNAVYSFNSCKHSGLSASKKTSLQPGRVDLSFVLSSNKSRPKVHLSFPHPNVPIKEFCRKTNAVNQDSIDSRNNQIDEPRRSYPTVEEETGENKDTLAADNISQVKKSSARIHDFCFGIPFGGIVLSGGVMGFLFSGNRATLMNGLLFGGSLLALSSYSLKVWRQGKSCLPFMLGQSVLAVALLVKQVQIYALTKKILPTGLYIITSAAMLCFYLYVMLSGGNPPPKKLKLATST